MDVNHELSFTMAARLKQLREEAGLSHQKLSEQLATTISRDSLINYEVISEHHSSSFKNLGMSVKNLYALAAFYGVSTDYILGLTDTRSPSADVQTACQITGLNESSIFSLRRYMDVDDGYLSLHEKYGKQYSRYALDMVDEFIDYALNYSDENDIPFDKYLAFRQQNEERRDSIEKWKLMTLEEHQSHTFEMMEIHQTAFKCGFYPLFSADASDYFRTIFCDCFKDFLKEKYPLADIPHKQFKED